MFVIRIVCQEFKNIQYEDFRENDLGDDFVWGIVVNYEEYEVSSLVIVDEIFIVQEIMGEN